MSELLPVLSEAELREIDAEIAHVPYRDAVAIDALKIVQAHRGWVSDESLQAIARHLEMSAEELEGELFAALKQRTELHQQRHQVQGTTFNEVPFVDDTALFSTSTRALNQLLKTIQEEGHRQNIDKEKRQEIQSPGSGAGC